MFVFSFIPIFDFLELQVTVSLVIDRSTDLFFLKKTTKVFSFFELSEEQKVRKMQISKKKEVDPLTQSVAQLFDLSWSQLSV